MHRKTSGAKRATCAAPARTVDAYIVAKREEEQTKRVIPQEVGSMARFGVGVGGGVMVVKEIGKMAGDRVAGDKINSGRDTASAGRDTLLPTTPTSRPPKMTPWFRFPTMVTMIR